jgi:hypothetical protein
MRFNRALIRRDRCRLPFAIWGFPILLSCRSIRIQFLRPLPPLSWLPILSLRCKPNDVTHSSFAFFFLKQIRVSFISIPTPHVKPALRVNKTAMLHLRKDFTGLLTDAVVASLDWPMLKQLLHLFSPPQTRINHVRP